MSSLVGNYGRYDVSFVKGQGCFLYDEAGKEYLDFGCGISVVSLGHSHPAITEAIVRQAETLMHTSNLYKNPVQEKLGESLNKLSFGGKVFFCNSGAEANEAALKMARIYGNKKYDGKRYKVITMENSFHGRTFATLSATGQEKIHKGFEPIADWFIHVPYNDFNAIEKACAKGDVVAVMLEPAQGEGGVIAAERAYLERLRSFCNNQDILLIYDEIQTSMGRAGKIFGYENTGVAPDILTIAKALGNGVPIGAVIAKEKIAENFTPGTHGTTFGGNYLACAAGNAVIEELTKEGFLDSVNKKGAYLKDKLKTIFGDKAVEVRGNGLMLGVQLRENMSEFVKECLLNGLLVIPAGNETVRVYPPLNIDYENLDRGLAIMEKVLAGGKF
jgi:acetylornithine/N-succinyldiaminopimelate aminotransferase